MNKRTMCKLRKRNKLLKQNWKKASSFIALLYCNSTGTIHSVSPEHLSIVSTCRQTVICNCFYLSLDRNCQLLIVNCFLPLVVVLLFCTYWAVSIVHSIFDKQIPLLQNLNLDGSVENDLPLQGMFMHPVKVLSFLEKKGPWFINGKAI